MSFLQFNFGACLAGLLAVICIAFIRFYYPFRYYYLSLLFRRYPSVVLHLLERSYLKNKTIVGILDKSTKEILNREYDAAEKYIYEGIQLIRGHRTVQSRLAAAFFYSNLSLILYYRGKFNESLQIAFRIYERNPSSTAILALISCNFARLGDIQQAVESRSRLERMRGVNPSQLLSCAAEIEAAKGNREKALQLFHLAKKKYTFLSSYFLLEEIEDRIGQLKKSA